MKDHTPAHRQLAAAAQRGGSPDRHESEANAVALRSLSAPGDEAGLRRHVGTALGFDFSSVRFHRESSLATAEGALGVTTGRDVHVAPGRFRPDLPLGRALLAHELTHVAQQRAVPALANLADPTPGLSEAPLGMRQRTVGCNSCNDSGSSRDAGTDAGGDADAGADAGTRQPSAGPVHTVGPDAATAGNKILRIAWTIDDGPTRFTPGMATALGARGGTWYIMSNQLGSGAARTAAIQQLVTRQNAGGEIAIHSFHPSVAHSAWFPISIQGSVPPPAPPVVPQGYTTTQAAMNDLTAFTQELRSAGVNVRFARMPGGELSEVKKYVETAGTTSNSEGIAQALLQGTTPPAPAPAQVATDVALVQSTLTSLGLHLWGGTVSGPEVRRTTWEAESSGVPSRTDDALRRVRGVIDQMAAGTRTTPASFVILAHDTTQADVTHVGQDIANMESYAVQKGVRIEYYGMSGLYQTLRGTPP